MLFVLGRLTPLVLFWLVAALCERRGGRSPLSDHHPPQRGAACLSSTGRLRVRFVHAVPPKQVQHRDASTPPTFPRVTYPEPARLALRPGESGGVTVTWDNWCDPQIPGKKRVPPKAIRVTLPDGGGNLDADYNAVVPCLDPAQPSTLGVSVFQPNLVRRAAGGPTRSYARRLGRAAAGAPRRRSSDFRRGAGGPLTTPALFTRCPAYPALEPAGRLQVDSLNCRAARPNPPHGGRASRCASTCRATPRSAKAVLDAHAAARARAERAASTSAADGALTASGWLGKPSKGRDQRQAADPPGLPRSR